MSGERREVLEDRGWDGLTIAEVAQRAGVSVGSVYTRFADKDELIFSLHQAFLERLRVDRPFDVSDDLSLAVLVRRLVDGYIAMLGRHERLMRAFMLASSTHQRIRDAGSQQTRLFSREFARRLLQRRDEFAHQHVEIAADMCFRIAFDVGARRLMRGATF